MQKEKQINRKIQLDCHPGSVGGPQGAGVSSVCLGYVRKGNEQAICIGRKPAGDPGVLRTAISGMTTLLNRLSGHALTYNGVSPSPLVGEGARRAGEGFSRGFTLIELLVVVLIIGILAAVALPQYQAAVLKSKAQHGIITLDALAKAQQIYYLTHGQYAENLEALDIQTEEDIRGSSKATLGFIRVASDLSIEYVWGWNPMQRRCIARSVLAHKVCQSLGGKPMRHGNNTDTVQYYLLP